MKEKFINSGIKFISKYETCDDLKLIKLKYGLEGIYTLFIKSAVVLIIAFFTHSITSTALMMIFYAGIRTYSFGLHAKSNIGCWITTLIIYNIIPLLVKNYTIPLIIGYIIIGVSILSIIIWSPADTPKRPLIRPKQRLKCKIKSTIIAIIYLIIYIFTTNTLIESAIIYALLLQSICINPVTYKITKTKFNNYKYYPTKLV